MPPDHSAKFAQVGQHINAGRYEQAKAILQRVLQVSPADPAANNGMSIALSNLGQAEGALLYAQRAVAAAPDDANNLNTLGSAYNALQRFTDAIKVLERALALDPRDAVPRITLCNAYWGLDRFTDSTRCLAEGLDILPAHPELTSRIAPQLVLLGKADEAVRRCRASLAHYPGHPEAALKLCSSIIYSHTASPREVFEAHKAYGEALAASLPTPARRFANPPDPERRLRVGFLSADFRQHSVAFFAELLLKHLDHERFHLTCYSNNSKVDAVTKRMKASVHDWRQIDTLTDAPAAERIFNDKIDLLIDLHGVSVGHRMNLFQLRPAPVQLTYCGYPATTGVKTIDFRLIDSITDPAPEGDALATERLLRLDPCFLCYNAEPLAPDPAPPPCAGNPAAGTPLTFGSFNTTAKLNPRTAALWSRVLHAVPDSRLVLKSYQFADAGTRDSIAALFAPHSITPPRLELLPPEKGQDAHLKAYERLDIALDPVPYAGTTTTCEAMWMGVPVVTLRGEMHAGRVGASLLTQVALADLIARDEDEYVRLAAALANDAPRRAALRSSLRERMRASPLMDAPSHAARFADALRAAWRAWCAPRTRPA